MNILTRNYLLQYDFTSRSFEIIEDGSVFYSDEGSIPGMAIDEEGHFMVSGGGKIVSRNHAVEYDLRPGRFFRKSILMTGITTLLAGSKIISSLFSNQKIFIRTAPGFGFLIWITISR